ncbi:hypothetical protein SERLA73DRAFT_175349 [Serpula lacrymans var. lacrymans S7.3]|uniref:Uncharacterized protein n=2 Tax=Serpula lacrymans var. lacrymans TaxID=341189 RepID=F8PJA9_SERL3|nr:uncharacterized protein SERLADRAFT_457567 [Serpula lacrymans var. lacrymans S7.9]EGO03734.1 hypothetical protein SERLA73DRAFT_175349 [Serpula lacrymans var. lacrymans S7.3]EGO29600.1 hypothetical protein SERLADRAFT_457567 [Serpula lacrymans var. lacrymans S7.9]
MQREHEVENLEDIMSDSIEMFGGETLEDNGTIQYGPLVLGVAPKEGKANTLLADHLFSPALLLAEQVERGLIPVQGQKVLEIGAGCALPSLLMATLPEPPCLVTVSDYPDEIILGNLKRNVDKNRPQFQSNCTVRCIGYEWGKDPGPLLALLPPHDNLGYDIMILSDLLHFNNSHEALITAITSFLVTSATSRVYVAAGKYTAADVCSGFLRMSTLMGLIWEEGADPSNANPVTWLGEMQVSGLDKGQLADRKGMCRWWIGRWSESHLDVWSPR